MKRFFLFLLSLSFVITYAQRGKDGNINVSNSNVVLNTYTYLTQDALQGSNNINVASTAGLNTGDLVLIIQMQGAMLKGLINSGLFNDTWGAVLSYQNCGLYEFQQVNSISSNQIVLDCNLKNSYDTVGKTQIVKVPRYNIFTIVNGASLTCLPWNGQTGGIVVIESLNNVTVNGLINATGKGFRGGIKDNGSVASNVQIFDVASLDSAYGGEKGEGIGGFGSMYTVLGGRYGRGAAANGGGGGNGHNSGGGGGANAGIGTWNGLGNPDNGNGNVYAQAWNLESNNFSNNVSGGGGRGGYSFSTEDLDALTIIPGLSFWGGNNRANNGGYGGRSLNYGINTERVFLGGGGGAGDGNDSASTNGANGGGLVFIISHSNITGTGNITANGNIGFVTLPYGNDAPGGGGGGGTIILNASGTISNISANANGAQGGNQNISTPEAEGPGGGGGGGYIAKSSGTFNQQANGGTNGVTNSLSMVEFPPNGATKGANGLINQSVTNFSLSTIGDTICPGNTANIYASLSGNFPSGTVLNWYQNISGGTPFYTGTAWTTSILYTSTTYYVGSCPGTYRIPVTVTVNQPPVVNAGADTSVCIGFGTQLTASGGVSYLWFADTTLSNISIPNPIASPVTNTTYTVTVTDLNGCTNTDTVVVGVNPLPTVTISTTQNFICLGFSAQLTAFGGILYQWNTGQTSASIIVSPSISTIYIVTVTDNEGCTNTANLPINVMPLPITNAGADTMVCFGSGIPLNASGGTTYTWTPASTLDSSTISNPIATPLITTTYTVTALNIFGCSSQDDVVVTVNPLPLATVGGNQNICLGDSTLLNASGGVSYQWSSGENTQNIVVTPVVNSTYTVTATDILGCINTDDIFIMVHPLPVAYAGLDTSICPGTSSQLNASGGINYSWSPASGLNNSLISNPVATPASNITYTVTVTDTNGCIQTDKVSITLYPVPDVFAAADIYAGCPPLEVNFNDTASNNIGWQWNFGDPISDTNNISSIQNPSHIYNYPGTYSVSLAVTSNHGCTKTNLFNNLITVYPNPIASFETQPTSTNIFQPTITFDNTSVDGVSWYWNFGDIIQATSTDFSPTYTYNEEGVYVVSLLVLSQYGCADSTSGEVVIKPEYTFFIPNVFTPDDDGINDYFQGVGRNFSNYQMFIYDRWGKLIFETHDYTRPWNGKIQNGSEFCMAGVYVYIITVKDFKGRDYTYRGDVTLLK